MHTHVPVGFVSTLLAAIPSISLRGRETGVDLGIICAPASLVVSTEVIKNFSGMVEGGQVRLTSCGGK